MREGVRRLCLTGVSLAVLLPVATAASAQNATFREREEVQRDVVGRYVRTYVVDVTNRDNRVIICNVMFNYREAPGNQYRTSSVNQGVYPGRTERVTLRGYYSGTVQWSSRCRY